MPGGCVGSKLKEPHATIGLLHRKLTELVRDNICNILCESKPEAPVIERIRSPLFMAALGCSRFHMAAAPATTLVITSDVVYGAQDKPSPQLSSPFLSSRTSQSSGLEISSTDWSFACNSSMSIPASPCTPFTEMRKSPALICNASRTCWL